MRELSFVGLSDDGSHLVVAGADGQKYTVPIDERLTVAVRRDRTRLGQLEIDLEGGLRPRDIQARIRAGMTAEEVASLAGVPVEKVQRFEAPVLAERAYVAEKARATDVRTAEGTATLESLVVARLDARGLDPAATRWDAWRRDDGRWVVLLNWRAEGGTERSALWVYDVVARAVLPDDDEARRLVDDSPEPQPVATERVGTPHLVPVPNTPEPVDEEPDDVAPYDQEADVPLPLDGDADDVEPAGSAAPAATPSDEPPLARRVRRNDRDADNDTVVVPRERPAAGAPGGTGRQKRPAVPSWDEILFGAPKSTD